MQQVCGPPADLLHRRRTTTATTPSPTHITKACPATMHSPAGRPPLLLMITPCHHCTRTHTALALSHESEWPRRS
eukprot:scaffold39874_cov66-Phaeocystis_antarctica.AAC.1